MRLCYHENERGFFRRTVRKDGAGGIIRRESRARTDDRGISLLGGLTGIMRIQSLLKPSLAGLAAVILGLVYRYFDLDFGLPFAYRFDEMPMVEGSLRMAADKTLRPALAEYPSL